MHRLNDDNTPLLDFYCSELCFKRHDRAQSLTKLSYFFTATPGFHQNRIPIFQNLRKTKAVRSGVHAAKKRQSTYPSFSRRRWMSSFFFAKELGDDGRFLLNKRGRKYFSSRFCRDGQRFLREYLFGNLRL